MTAETKFITIAELEQMPNDRGRCELLDGELVDMAPANVEHNAIIAEVTMVLGGYVKQHDLGRVFAGDTGIVLRRNPDRVRAPDVCFIAKERLPIGRLPRTFSDIIPDLVVEVVSPGDRAAEIQQKTAEWLQAGVRLVWHLYPDTQTVVAIDNPITTHTYRAGEMLPGEPVLPGFAVSVAALFA